MKENAFLQDPACGTWGEKECSVTRQGEWVFLGHLCPFLDLLSSPNCTRSVAAIHSAKFSAWLFAWLKYSGLTRNPPTVFSCSTKRSCIPYSYQHIKQTNSNSSRHLPHHHASCHLLVVREPLVQNTYISFPFHLLMYVLYTPG